jgi:hypothetical protein
VQHELIAIANEILGRNTDVKFFGMVRSFIGIGRSPPGSLCKSALRLNQPVWSNTVTQQNKMGTNPSTFIGF